MAPRRGRALALAAITLGLLLLGLLGAFVTDPAATATEGYVVAIHCAQGLVIGGSAYLFAVRRPD